MLENTNGRYLVVVSGPSGCGKDTIVDRLLGDNPDMSISVSYTSRSKREYEEEGKHYYFTSREDFERRRNEGLMLESVEYNGNYYGTPLPELCQKLDKKETVILVIEVTGGMTVKKMFPDALLVFIVPPSMEELEKRLRIRRTETDEELKGRLDIARHEMTFAENYDIILVNNEIMECKAELEKEILRWQNT